MFELAAIAAAHSKVKSGADFPAYITEIRSLGVVRFETWVKDSHTVYFGATDFQLSAPGLFEPLTIADNCDLPTFKTRLLLHQQDYTDFVTFCNDCAATGIEKWVMDLNEKTCTYFDKNNTEQLVEKLP
jgi:uncharacterized protein YbcV (DUF1398 family)